ncbi:hypothetical protein L1987_85599 [Smallanthus sonchifolius]|uniref:Uncharacterized protein n=1 Tax=Smallanthus sonchifolius TaxID=185202 RepID=A0ACB8XXM0_9ASTR|nr:hypothetical protein L1987_85599 [Smallanthus sonchifolius]
MTGSRHQNDTVENFVRQNTRMIVKHSSEQKPNTGLYKYKDCNKEYTSFQALGGHRASHRAPIPHTPTDNSGVQFPESTRHKRKLHECKICKKGFEIGQSLGGHMRKHWRRNDKNCMDVVVAESLSSSCSSSSTSIAGGSKGEVVFEYDLNLMPDENEWSKEAQLDQDSSLPS